MDSREPLRMSSSEPHGMMPGSNNFAGGAPNSSMAMPPSSVGMMPGMRLSFNSAPPTSSKPMDSSSLFHGDGGTSTQGMSPGSLLNMSGESMKKKRGRPRKYGPDGSMALALSPLSSASAYSNSPMSESSGKKRGRPPGSGKKQQLYALGSGGIAFTPHVITIQAGEDVASKILAFSQQSPRTVCVLSANGVICNVTLRQPATSGGTVNYEGRFEILSLSGSYLLTDDGGTRSRTGGLSVALAGSDGRVLGGSVAGMLMAAGPVQVVAGSFIADAKKPKPETVKCEPSSTLPQMASFSAPPPTGSPPSQGSLSESSDDDPGSPIDHGGGVNCNNPGPGQNVHGMPFTTVGWSHSVNQHRHSDTNMMP